MSDRYLEKAKRAEVLVKEAQETYKQTIDKIDEAFKAISAFMLEEGDSSFRRSLGEEHRRLAILGLAQILNAVEGSNIEKLLESTSYDIDRAIIFIQDYAASEDGS